MANFASGFPPFGCTEASKNRNYALDAIVTHYRFHALSAAFIDAVPVLWRPNIV